MTLGEWLDDVIVERAAEQGVDPEDIDNDDRLEAIADRLSGLPRRGEDRARRRRSEADEDEAPVRRFVSREDARRAEDLLEAAIARFESRVAKSEARAAKSEERTARALDSLAQWVEKSESGERGEKKASELLAERLDAIETQIVKRREAEAAAAAQTPDRVEGALSAMRQVENAARDLDKRMADLARRMEEAERNRSQARPRLDLAQAVSQIARRRQALDSSQAAPAASARVEPTNGWRNFGVDAPAAQPPKEAAKDAAAVAANELRVELQRLNQRLDEIRRDQTEKRAAPEADVAALRSELTVMSNALVDLAPRNAVVAIEGAVRDLSDRVGALRDNSLRDSLVKPVDEIVAAIRETLQAHDPRKAVAGLERDIAAIRDRLDALARTRVDPDALERIRQQTEEVRGMLSAAALRPMPVDRLEKQIGELADRVDRLASSRSPHVESAQVVASLANARAEIERSTPTLALSVIERRLEDIAVKIDQALARSQSASTIGPKAVEELARRIDSVRETIETRHPLPIVSASLEATMRELAAKLQDAQTSRFDKEPLDAWMREVSEKLEAARPVALDTKPLESWMRDLTAKLQDAQTSRFDKDRFEAWMREISEKLDAARPLAVDTKPFENSVRELAATLRGAQPPRFEKEPFEAWMREVSEKLDAARPVTLDTKPLEGWMRDLTAKLQEAQTSRFDKESFEAWMREVSEKLDAARPLAVDTRQFENSVQELAAIVQDAQTSRFDKEPLESWMREVSEKLDAARPLAVDTKPFENSVRELAATLQGAQATRFDKEPLEAWMREVSEKLETARPITLDTRPLEGWMRDLTAKLDSAHPSGFDTKPLEEALRAIDDKISQAAAPTQFEPALVDQTAQALARQIEAKLRPAADISVIESLIRGLEDKLGHVGGVEMGSDSLIELRDQIGRIDARLDQTHADLSVLRSMGQSVGQFSTKLDEMREALRAAQSAVAERDDRAWAERDIDSLRATQETSERRVQTSLGGVQGLLEKLVDRMARIEDDVVRASRAPLETPRETTVAAPAATTPDAFESPPPKRIIVPPPINLPPPERSTSRSASLMRISDAPDFLIEPGAGAPVATLGRDANIAPQPKAAINAHIAAARRAAQAAMADAASAAPPAEKAKAADALNASIGRPIAQARAFLNARRRPILLGLAFVILGAIAVIELGAMYVVKTQKSEMATPTPAMTASQAPQKSEARAVAVDPTPTGSLVAPQPGAPATSLPPDHKPAVAPPADLVALIPAATPQTLRALAVSGDPAAEFELATRLFEGRAMTRDIHAAAQWFERAANQNLAPAQYRIGACYEKGNGVERDPALAKAWYEKAAEAGNVRAMHNLAVLVAEGPSVKPDYAEAATWFRKAALYGVKDSQYNLAILYARGMGVGLDLNQSWLWFSLAAQQGDADAAKKRDEVAAKLDANALTADGAALAAFKPRQPDPGANDVKAPDGGWDGKAPTQATDSPSKITRPATPL